MSYRGQESPMDFQWENTSGRMDPNSPFATTGIKRTTVSTERDNGIAGASKHHAPETPVKKTNTSIFQSSPVKQQPMFFSTPAQMTFSPSTPHSKLPVAPPFRTPSFTTPRCDFDTPSKDSDAFSTPGDTQETDSEAPTPEVQLTQILRSGKKGSLKSLVVTPSRVSGRGELRRGHAVTKSARWRRPIVKVEIGRGYGSDDSEEEPDSTPVPRTSRNARKPKGAAEDWVKTHSHLPLIMMQYVLLFFWMSFVFSAVWIMYNCYQTVTQDVEFKVQESSSKVSDQMTECSKQYLQNRCAPDIRVPAIEHQCQEWERCMNQDPKKIGRARVSAVTFAEIINSFVNELGFKTLALLAFLLLGMIRATMFVATTKSNLSSRPINLPRPGEDAYYDGGPPGYRRGPIEHEGFGALQES